MIKYVVDAVKEAGAEDVCVITGYRHDIVEGWLANYDSNIKQHFKSHSSARDMLLCRQENLSLPTRTTTF